MRLFPRIVLSHVWVISHWNVLLPSAVCDPVCVTEAPKYPTSEELETPTKDSHLIPTPQAPSIAFPLANPPVAPHPREKVCHPELGGDGSWILMLCGIQNLLDPHQGFIRCWKLHFLALNFLYLITQKTKCYCERTIYLINFLNVTLSKITLPFQITIEETHEDLKKQYTFQLSSLNPQERIDYCHLIEKLGTSILFKNIPHNNLCRRQMWMYYYHL